MGNTPIHTRSDVTDPSDFAATKVPELAQIDALARCYICKEHYRAPLLTGCNHTFCSQCIRELLMTEEKCPLCKLELFESNLRRDIILDEIVGVLKQVRPRLVSELAVEPARAEPTEEPGCQRSPEPSKHTPSKPSSPSSPSSKHPSPDTSGSDIEMILERKRPQSDDDVVELDGDSRCPICDRAMPAEFIQAKHLDKCLQGQGHLALPLPPTKRPKTSITAFFGASLSKKRPLALISRETTRSPVDKPVDRAEAYVQNAVSHADTEGKRLPKLNYLLLPTPKLKEKLAALKLPTSGTRAQLELRYNRYYVIYNANLDATVRQDDRVLRQQLRQWELSHLAFVLLETTLFDRALAVSSRNIADKNFSVTEWNTEYASEFRRLRRQARRLIKRAPQEASE